MTAPTLREGIAAVIIRRHPETRDGITLDQALRLAGRMFLHGALTGICLGAVALWTLAEVFGWLR